MAVIVILVGGGTAKKDFIMVRIQGCSLLGLDLLGLNNIPHFVLCVCFLMSNLFVCLINTVPRLASG